MKYNFIEQVKRFFFNLEDWFFEKKYGFDFGGIILNENLKSDNKESIRHSSAYQAVWCHNISTLLLESNKIGKFSNFIDIGSGKGKACLYANFKYKFEKIIGVEFSKDLVNIANENKDRAKTENVCFLNCDATEFSLPDSRSLVFMFNPFDEVILEKFVRKNLDLFKKTNSIIAYANDVHRVCLLQFGFKAIFRDADRKISLYIIN